MVGASPLERHAALGDVAPLGGVATVEKIAANAVMAGCEPAHFPVVLAAVQAILDPTFNLRGVQTTDENVTPLLIVKDRRRRGSGSTRAGAPSAPAGRPTRPSDARCARS